MRINPRHYLFLYFPGTEYLLPNINRQVLYFSNFQKHVFNVHAIIIFMVGWKCLLLDLKLAAHIPYPESSGRYAYDGRNNADMPVYRDTLNRPLYIFASKTAYDAYYWSVAPVVGSANRVVWYTNTQAITALKTTSYWYNGTDNSWVLFYHQDMTITCLGEWLTLI